MLNAAETAWGLRARTDKGSASALLWRGGGGGDAGRERASSHLPSCDLRQKLVRLRISGRGSLRGAGSTSGLGVRMYTLWTSSRGNRTWPLCTSKPRGRDARRRGGVAWVPAFRCLGIDAGSRGGGGIGCGGESALRAGRSPPEEAAPPGF